MNQRDLLDQLFLARLTDLEAQLERFPRLKYAIAHHRNIRGQPMQFHDKPYLVEIYKDDAQEIVLQSSVQTGKSEFLIVSAHSWAERGLQVLYVLPTIELRNLFVANRVDKLYSQIDHYAKQIAVAKGHSDARGLKHFGPNHGAIFFAGSNSETTFIEKPIDIVIGDETDRFNQVNYEKADDRMTASPYKLKYEASNPTVDNYGVNYRYNLSDQRQWFVKCECCNKWQAMDWFRNVVRQTDDNSYRLLDTEWTPDSGRDIFMGCVRCGKPLSRFAKGVWVPKVKNLKTHGYHIHQMLSSYVRLDEMWLKFQQGLESDTKLQVFYNSMLGLTFAGKGSKITDDILNKCKEDYLMPSKADPCVMGVDVGKRLHVVIRQIVEGGRLRMVYCGTVREFEELDYLFARFNIVSYVIDAMPETRKATEYAKKHTGRGWICRYHHGLEEIKTNDDDRVVSADRTMVMDRVLSMYTQRRYILPKNANTIDKGEYYSMLKTPTRIYNEEKNCYEWLGDPDHYFHAEVYSLLAFMVRGDFRVVGVRPATYVAKPPPKEFDLKMFPPGTPEHIIEHYKNLYLQAKQQDKMDVES